jgi:uncharacterized protein (UPF0332 family)
MQRLGHRDDAVSRAYYAIHHAARALIVEQREPPQTHRGLVHVLHEEFHGPDLLSTKHLEALTEAQRLREVSDYDPSFEPTEEDVEATVVAAESFVDKVARLLAD